MTRYVHQEVAAARDDPTESESIRLLVGVSGSTDAVAAHVRHNRGEVVEELPFDSLVVSVPEVEISSLCELSQVESLELDEGMETLQGN